MKPEQYPLEDLVADRYSSPEWATVFELAGGVGDRGYNRRADVAAFNCWPSKGLSRLAFEIKRTRPDFLKEVDTPDKRAWLEKHFHQTYFVVSPGIVKVDEVPESWGLLVATKAGDKLTRRKVAKHREVDPLPEFLALSAIRSLSDHMQVERSKHYTLEGEALTLEDLEDKIEVMLEAKRGKVREEWNTVRALRRKIADRQTEIEAPLQALAEAAGVFGLFSEWSRAPDKVTGEDVRKWIEVVRTQAVRGAMREVRQAHEALGQLLAHVEALGLDAGELPGPRLRRARKTALG